VLDMRRHRLRADHEQLRDLTPDQVADTIINVLSNLPVTVTPSPSCDSGLSARSGRRTGQR